MSRKAIPRPLRQYIITESRGYCNLCHRLRVDEIHHIHPVAEGGSDDYDNLIALCGSCHSRIHKSAILPDRLKKAKYHWVNQCHELIAELLSDGGGDLFLKMSSVLESFDAVYDKKELEGFRDRLNHLNNRNTLFGGIFRVFDHQLSMVINDVGDAKVWERQRWSSFSKMNYRDYHIEGASPCSLDAMAFEASASLRGRAVDISVEVLSDHPQYKSFRVLFGDTIPAKETVTVELGYSWPDTWDLAQDRYTYDVLAWAEKFDYTMVFPKNVRVRKVWDSYLDALGSQWDSIGSFRCPTPNSFKWSGRHLPVFSTIIIGYHTDS